MKYVALLFAVCLLTGCTPGTTPVSPSPSDASVDSSSTESGGTADADSDVIVIDVRSEDEWNSGHVEQAIHIPHTEIGQRISEVTGDKEAKIVVYCAVGGRAGKAKAKLEELGFSNVENGGGFDDVMDRFQ